jgi:hypothetical protein
MAEYESTVASAQTPPQHAFWYRRLFTIIATVCLVFIAFTTTAMFLYPGGAVPVAHTHGYQFFINFFSDLGQTRTQAGVTNYPSMLLFSSAMAIVGVGLAVFFIAFAKFFASKPATVWAKRVSLAATVVGLIAAICFIGIGATPYNLFFLEHQAFVQWGFRSLLLAVILESIAIRGAQGISSTLLRVNVAFVVILFGYLMLMMFGPGTGTIIGDEIHAVGQKIIVYTAISTIFAQAFLVHSHINQPVEQAEFAAVREG